MLMMPFFNYAEGNHDAIYDMMSHPAAVSGLSDGGAHCGLICDASYPTYLLTHWARDRHRGPRFSLEYVVRKQTRDTATLFGLSDRGVLDGRQEGRRQRHRHGRADISVSPRWCTTCRPAGGDWCRAPVATTPPWSAGW